MDKDMQQLKPWVRFWVRNFDFIIFFLFIRMILWNGLMCIENYPFIRLLIIGVCIILVESMFISFFGKTPGKWIGNIKVKNCKGDNPTFNQALRRTLLVWIKGVFLYIPFVSFIAMWVSKNSLIKTGNTYWDEVCRTNVEYSVLPIWRYTIMIMIVIVFNLMIYIAAIDYLVSLVMKSILW
ncbi:RDD family protein [Anaerosinus massiliensis]|uniref:RDD family protein n=1 Tax=Massilibacillus massiliensis TaxID=1806837 RepID=UPI000DA5F61F|nr:RDD family protein [Massilibacillus massiliensis]